ncbi:hypothetical protein AGMMS49992_17830 [Clostridia bacterium]|nr:hypothetical protein AGMMS49992_17830 [Clostridia bacterium]
MAEAIAVFLEKYLNPYLVVFIISLLPVIELRGGLIVASVLGLNWWLAAIVCMAGNMLPVPFVVIFGKRILVYWSEHGRIKLVRRGARWMRNKAQHVGQRWARRYPRKVWLGILIFVGIPLPGTGAWTAAIASTLMGLRTKYVTLPICLGVILACAAMLLLAYVLPGLFAL